MPLGWGEGSVVEVVAEKVWTRVCSPGLTSPCPGGSGRDWGIPPRKLANDTSSVSTLGFIERLAAMNEVRNGWKMNSDGSI